MARTVPQIIREERVGYQEACRRHAAELAAEPHQHFEPPLYPADERKGYKITVDTAHTPDGVIAQEVRTFGDQVTRFIMDTRDAQVRAALIALGWTPPVALPPNGEDFSQP